MLELLDSFRGYWENLTLIEWGVEKSPLKGALGFCGTSHINDILEETNPSPL